MRHSSSQLSVCVQFRCATITRHVENVAASAVNDESTLISERSRSRWPVRKQTCTSTRPDCICWQRHSWVHVSSINYAQKNKRIAYRLWLRTVSPLQMEHKKWLRFFCFVSSVWEVLCRLICTQRTHVDKSTSHFNRLLLPSFASIKRTGGVAVEPNISHKMLTECGSRSNLHSLTFIHFNTDRLANNCQHGK